MHITVEPRDNYAILHLRGKFDTCYVPLLQEKIDGLLSAGINNVVMNLRLVEFLSSAALGAIVKASKQLAAVDGRLMISRPSKFCRDNIEKAGLNSVISIYESDEAAAAKLPAAQLQSAKAAVEEAFEKDKSSVLFQPAGFDRVQHSVAEGIEPVNFVHGHNFGKTWIGLGRKSGLDEQSLSFTWTGGKTDLPPFAMAQLFAIGTRWYVKFYLPLLRKGYCEAVASVSEVEERPEGVKVRARFREIDDEARRWIKNYADDA